MQKLMSEIRRGQPQKIVDDQTRFEQLQLIARLDEAIKSISSKNNFREVAQEVTRQLADVLHADRVVACQWGEEEDEFILQAEYPLPDRKPTAIDEAGIRFPADREIIKAFGKDSSSQLALDELKRGKSAALFEGWEQGSLLLLPAVLPRGTKGFALAFCKGEDRRFSNAEIALSKLLLRHTALIVEYLLLLQDAEQRGSQLEELRQASLNITSSLDQTDVLYALLGSALKMLQGAKDAHIFLYDGDKLSFGAAMWADGRKSEPWSEPREHGLTYTVARTAGTVPVEDMRIHPLFKGTPADWTGAIIGLPIKFAGKVVGVMNIGWPEPRHFEREELHLIQLLADQAAIAIQNAHQMAQSERRGTELEALHQASLKLTSTLDIGLVLRAILENAMKMLEGVDNAHIYTYDGETLRFGAARWAGGREGQAWVKPNPDGLVYSVARSGEMLPIGNMGKHSQYKDSHTRWKGAVVAMPLKVARRVAGVMVIAYQEPREFEAGELNLINLLADQAAIALENARLHGLTQEEALTDPLTELPNRRAFDIRLAEEIRRSTRYGHSFALVMMDLDGFKRINDTYGHIVGDVALKDISRCLRYSVRDTDFLARFGGDEFVLILPETKGDDAGIISHKLQKTVLDCRINWAEAKDERVTLSIGVASFPLDAKEPAALIGKADKALYRSKNR